MRLAHAHTGNATVIGVTGPPGVGKSTLVDGLAERAREHRKTVGILAVDPTSPFTGGAVLGDRIRMQRHYLDEAVFIRSLATRGAHGGLTSVARAGVRLLDAVGKDLIFVETVGVGQTEIDVAGVADVVVVVLAPESGDSVQTMKAGLLEIADIFVVNKADRDGAGQLVTAIRAAISLGAGRAEGPHSVMTTEAHQAEGVSELFDAAMTLSERRERSRPLADTMNEWGSNEVIGLVASEVSSLVNEAARSDERVSDLVKRVEEGELDAHSAAHQIFMYGLKSLPGLDHVP